MGYIKSIVKGIIKKVPGLSKMLVVRYTYPKYSRAHDIKQVDYIIKFWKCFYYANYSENKVEQIGKLLERIDIDPVESNLFFYSIDCFKILESKKQMLVNYTIDNDVIVNSSIKEMEMMLVDDSSFAKQEKMLINQLKKYVNRCKEQFGNDKRYIDSFEAMESLFARPADTFFEGLQRILFFNQILWQTQHLHVGLGRLDVILDRVYQNEIENGTITREKAKQMLKEFMRILHKYYWLKSGLMLGDTGQIIIVGGIDKNNNYFANDLTYLFIEIMMELHCTEPKVLLRYSGEMPRELLDLSLKSISTGLGAPLLSNDKLVVKNLIGFGYETDDAYNYSASACWEPLITNNSADLNNIASFNFAIPFLSLFNRDEMWQDVEFDEIMDLYELELEKYIESVLGKLSMLEFEIDPLLSLVSISSMANGMDITSGGAKYNHLGLTSVGIGSVVNSLCNIKRFVYEEKKYSLNELNEYRQENYSGVPELLQELKKGSPAFGEDEQYIIELTNKITLMTSQLFEKYHTKHGGKFKFGLSSPYYIEDAESIDATFDGRRKGEPFNVHISSNNAIPLTSLLLFASRLDYSGNRLNGNVVDFILTPAVIKENMDKIRFLIKNAMSEGIYQMQINVVDSKTLIDAKNNPRDFPNLIVRVWGFSAYFNDLPEEYQNLLIARAIESERAA